MGFAFVVVMSGCVSSSGTVQGAAAEAGGTSESGSDVEIVEADGSGTKDSGDSQEQGDGIGGPRAESLQITGSFVHLPLPWGDNDPPFTGTETEFPEMTKGLIADVDGDGIFEVVVSSDLFKWPKAFRWDPGTKGLVAAPDLLVFDDSANFADVCAAIDLDGDSVVDFVMGHSETTKVVPFHWTVVFHQNADGTIRPGGPSPDADGVDLEINAGGAVDFADLDSDGWLDLLLGDRICGDAVEKGYSQHPLLRVALDRFERRDELFEKTWRTLPEMLFVRPVGPDPQLSFVAGHNCSPGAPMDGFYQYFRDEETGYPRFAPFDPTPVESEYKKDVQVAYGPITKQSPMGAALADFNHDGLVDMSISLFNYYAIMEATATWPFVDRTMLVGVSPPKGTLHLPPGSELHTIPWGMAPLDIDLDGFSDLVVAHGDDYTTHVNSEKAVGDHRTVVLRNLGGFAFEDITAETGLGKWGNWRALSVGDLNRDGRADLIVGGVGRLPHVYLNAIDTPHHGFAVELRGTTSNHLGIGAKVEVNTSGAPPQTQIMGNVSSPLVTSQPIVFFGTGLAESVDLLRVTWPSGHVQELQGLDASGVHVIEEPPVIALEPVTRHAPADGESKIVVRVWPRDASGGVIPGEVSIEALVGDAVFAGPAELQPDGSWIRALVSPVESGSSVIEVEIDGVALWVRPRLWWDAAEEAP
jgi:hypothetical protein